MKSIKVGLLQFRIEPGRTREATLKHAEKLLARAYKEEVDIVSLPERWNYFKSTIENNIELNNGKTSTFLKEVAAEYGMYIIGGAIWEYDKDKIEKHITCGIFNPKGELVAVQQKLHLYLYEKSIFVPGQQLKIIDLEFGKIGIAICFDMIFPEVARFYALNGVDLIFSPVLIREEGIENWHIYLKARALENRMPICAINCVGQINDTIYPGQSLIIDFIKGFETPSKLKIRQAPKYEEILMIDVIDLYTARKFRKKRLAERLELDDKILGKIVK